MDKAYLNLHPAMPIAPALLAEHLSRQIRVCSSTIAALTPAPPGGCCFADPSSLQPLQTLSTEQQHYRRYCAGDRVRSASARPRSSSQRLQAFTSPATISSHAGISCRAFVASAATARCF